MKATTFASIILALALATMAEAGRQYTLVTCPQVDMCLAPCVPYLTRKQAAPPPECCTGVSRLKALGSTTADRQVACSCVKQAAARFPDLDGEAVSALPTKCGVPLPFPISLDFDCSK